MTYQVDILNPKAGKLLQDLADMDLISIKEDKTKGDDFFITINKLRKKAAKNPISLDEITKEVEAVRSKRYASRKK